MVTKRTPLTTLVKLAWRENGLLKYADLDGVLRSFPIGRYNDSLLNGPNGKTIDPNKYELIEGTNDETGRPYRVIAEKWEPVATCSSKPTYEQLEKEIVRLNSIMKAIGEAATLHKKAAEDILSKVEGNFTSI